jgi:hypothetical protein
LRETFNCQRGARDAWRFVAMEMWFIWLSERNERRVVTIKYWINTQNQINYGADIIIYWSSQCREQSSGATQRRLTVDAKAKSQQCVAAFASMTCRLIGFCKKAGRQSLDNRNFIILFCTSLRHDSKVPGPIYIDPTVNCLFFYSNYLSTFEDNDEQLGD